MRFLHNRLRICLSATFHSASTSLFHLLIFSIFTSLSISLSLSRIDPHTAAAVSHQAQGINQSARTHTHTHNTGHPTHSCTLLQPFASRTHTSRKLISIAANAHTDFCAWSEIRIEKNKYSGFDSNKAPRRKSTGMGKKYKIKALPVGHHSNRQKALRNLKCCCCYFRRKGLENREKLGVIDWSHLKKTHSKACIF